MNILICCVVWKKYSMVDGENLQWHSYTLLEDQFHIDLSIALILLFQESIQYWNEHLTSQILTNWSLLSAPLNKGSFSNIYSLWRSWGILLKNPTCILLKTYQVNNHNPEDWSVIQATYSSEKQHGHYIPFLDDRIQPNPNQLTTILGMLWFHSYCHCRVHL